MAAAKATVNEPAKALTAPNFPNPSAAPAPAVTEPIMIKTLQINAAVENVAYDYRQPYQRHWKHH